MAWASVLKRFITTVNTGLREQVDVANANGGGQIETVDLYDLWTRDGKDHGIGSLELPGNEPWAFGDGCNIAEALMGLQPSPFPQDTGLVETPDEMFDPHFTQAGNEAVAEEIANKVRER